MSEHSTSGADRYALVGCGGAKIVTSAPAPLRDLYTSQYFGMKREFAEKHCKAWWVLSAKHGAILPLAERHTYDREIGDVDTEVWARGVYLTLHMDDAKWISDDTELVVLAGQDYIDPIRATLDDLEESKQLGVTVRYPFAETRGIGEQMAVLSSLIEDPEAETEDVVEDDGDEDGDEPADDRAEYEQATFGEVV